MQITWEMMLIVCPLALLAGFVDSVAGGGGLISLPAYYLAGLPPVLAAGTNKLSASLGSALPGSALGAMLLQVIPENTMRIIVIAAIPLVAVIVLRRRESMSVRMCIPEKWMLAVGFFIGLFIGFYDGLVGPGTGTFLILLFTMILGMNAVMASGTAKIVNLASNVAALFTLLVNGNVLFLLGLPAALCAMVGGYLGAGMTIRRGAGFIRWMLMAVLALLLAKMIWDVVT